MLWLLTTGSVIYTSQLHLRISGKGKLILLSSGLWHRVVLYLLASVSKEHNTFTFKAKDKLVGSSDTKLHGTTAKYLTVVVLVTAHTWTIPKRWTTSYLQDVPNCACAAPTRCPIQQKDTCRVRRAFLCPCWIMKTKPPEHEVSLPTLQWHFVTHEPGSSVGIVTKLWAGRQRNRGSIPNWHRRCLSSPKRLPRGQSVKLITHLPSKFNLKNEWSYTTIFHNAFMATTSLLLWEAYFYWRNYLTP